MMRWAHLAGFLDGELQDVGFALPCACIHVSDSGVPERLSNLDILMSITQEVKFLIRRCGYILRTAKPGDQHSVRHAHTYTYMEDSVRYISILFLVFPGHIHRESM